MINVYCLDFNKEYSSPLISAFEAYQGFKVMGAQCNLVNNNEEMSRITEINENKQSNRN